MSKFLEQLTVVDSRQKIAGYPHMGIKQVATGERNEFANEVYSVYRLFIDWEKKITIADGVESRKDLSDAFRTVKHGLAEDLFSEFRPLVRELKLMLLEGKIKEAKFKVDEILELTYPK